MKGYCCECRKDIRTDLTYMTLSLSNALSAVITQANTKENIQHFQLRTSVLADTRRIER